MFLDLHVSDVIAAIYDRFVTKETKAKVEARVKNRTDPQGRVRIQCMIPLKTYVVLSSFGAFQSSESFFFTAASSEYVERRAVERGIMSTIMDSFKGGR